MMIHIVLLICTCGCVYCVCVRSTAMQLSAVAEEGLAELVSGVAAPLAMAAVLETLTARPPKPEVWWRCRPAGETAPPPGNPRGAQSGVASWAPWAHF